MIWTYISNFNLSSFHTSTHSSFHVYTSTHCMQSVWASYMFITKTHWFHYSKLLLYPAMSTFMLTTLYQPSLSVFENRFGTSYAQWNNMQGILPILLITIMIASYPGSQIFLVYMRKEGEPGIQSDVTNVTSYAKVGWVAGHDN